MELGCSQRTAAQWSFRKRTLGASVENQQEKPQENRGLRAAGAMGKAPVGSRERETNQVTRWQT